MIKNTLPASTPNCISCCGVFVSFDTVPFPHYRCSVCGHLWRPETIKPEYYFHTSRRNDLGPSNLSRKFAERLKFIQPLLSSGMHILEVGCAEGGFGALLKSQCGAYYAGVEVSEDAITASAILDAVHRTPINSLQISQRFDLILCFHVIEHLQDHFSALVAIRNHLSASGRVVLEVPNGAGNRWIPWDRNPEHLHFFSAASLAITCHRAGLAIEKLEGSCFESPAYNDSLRAQLKLADSPHEKQIRFLSRLAATAGPKFIVWGVGGDFNNYLRPYINPDSVAAYIDEGETKWGTVIDNIPVQSPAILETMPLTRIIIATLRYHSEIEHILTSRYNIPREQIVGLSRLLDFDKDIL